MSHRWLPPALLAWAALGAPGSKDRPRFVNILVPSPAEQQYTRVEGLNSRDQVLTAAPQGMQPIPASCYSAETRSCAAAVWSEKDGYQPIPSQYFSGYLLNDKGIVGGNRSFGLLFLWTPREGIRDFAHTSGSYCTGKMLIAINDKAEMIGYDCGNPNGGFLASEKDGVRYIAGARNVQPIALNDKGEVVGTSESGAFYWTEKDGLVNLRDRLGAATAIARAIDDKGLVFGTMTNGSGAEFFFLWDDKRGLRCTIPRSPSCSARLTASGDLLGTCGESGGPTRIWTWTPKTGMRDLGSLGYDAVLRDANRSLEAVGSYRSAPGAPRHAFVWSEEWGLIDIDPGFPGRTSNAKFINDGGVIAGEIEHAGAWWEASAVPCIWKPARK